LVFIIGFFIAVMEKTDDEAYYCSENDNIKDPGKESSEEANLSYIRRNHKNTKAAEYGEDKYNDSKKEDE